MLDKEDALKIRKKLKAKIEKTKKGRPHDLFVVYHANAMIASFTIRKGSNKSYRTIIFRSICTYHLMNVPA